MIEKFKEGDRVFCVLNYAIMGVITKKTSYHGMYLYSIKPDDEKNFKKFMRINPGNIVFLHWQLRKI